MLLWGRGWGVVVGVLAVGLGLSALPARADTSNDAFADAEVLPAGYQSTLDHNFGTSKEVGEPDHAGNVGGHSVWYSWTAPATETVTVDTCDTNNLNTLLAVYTGTAVNALTPVASNDDGCGTQSQLSFPAVQGTEYRIVVDGFGGATGSIALRIEQTPANDAFADAIVLAGLPVSASGTNRAATKEPNEDDHAGDVGGASVWYSWTAPVTGPVAVQTCGSNFDTLLGVYTGSAVGALTLVASDDNACASQSQATFQASSGVTYMIVVDGAEIFAQGATGTIDLDLVALPGNDAFADGQVMTGLPAMATGTCIAATKEPGEPDHAGFPGGTSVWFSWSAPSNGPVTVDACGSNFDTLLGVYTGAAVNALTPVAVDNDACGTASRVGVIATQGTTYLIAVDGLGPVGSVALAITAGLPPTTTSTTTLPGAPTTTTTLPPGLAPETMIDSGPKRKSRKRKVTFAFSASEAGATFACRLDAKPFVPCTSPTTMQLKRGKHVFQVQATNLAGYTDPSPAEMRFKRRR